MLFLLMLAMFISPEDIFNTGSERDDCDCGVCGKHCGVCGQLIAVIYIVIGFIVFVHLQMWHFLIDPWSH